MSQYILLYIRFINSTLNLHRNSENFVKNDVRVLVSFNGGLSYVKRWVAAVLDNRFSTFDDVGAAFTEKM